MQYYSEIRSGTCKTESVGAKFIKLNDKRNGGYYMHDPRLQLIDNSLDSPQILRWLRIQEFQTNLPRRSKTFLNRDSCVLRKKSCNPLKFADGQLPLNTTNIRKWYTLGQRYVYYVTGLRLTDPSNNHNYDYSPCFKNAGRSRWKIISTSPCAGGGVTSGPNETWWNESYHTIASALSSSTDTNPYIRDIDVSNVCVDKNQNRPELVGVKVEAGGKCWQHIHRDEYSVFDFSHWTLLGTHPGNSAALKGGRTNPIKRIAINGGTNLIFPSNHGMDRWKKYRDERTFYIKYVGRLGDSVNFASLETELQLKDMAVVASALQDTQDDEFEACGSPQEAANVPVFGNKYRFPSERTFGGFDYNLELDYPHYRYGGKQMVFTNVALKSADQLRQCSLGSVSNICYWQRRRGAIEEWVNYYDIFIRHAFGNQGCLKGGIVFP